MASGIEIIPELRVQDIDAAREMLVTVFGFSEAAGLLHLGTQRIALVQADQPSCHGGIDHLALAVPDVPQALAALQARGAVLESTTPQGPGHIAEFWDNGIAYVFLSGPEGARIELCARLPADTRPGLPGHDHIGIACTDIAATGAFFADLGFTLLSSVSLSRDDGITEVRFLSAGASVVELYEPPALRGKTATPAPNAFWNGLRLLGSGRPSGIHHGPDGLRVTLA